jgi:hypothetical protein
VSRLEGKGRRRETRKKSSEDFARQHWNNAVGEVFEGVTGRGGTVPARSMAAGTALAIKKKGPENLPAFGYPKNQNVT